MIIVCWEMILDIRFVVLMQMWKGLGDLLSFFYWGWLLVISWQFFLCCESSYLSIFLVCFSFTLSNYILSYFVLHNKDAYLFLWYDCFVFGGFSMIEPNHFNHSIELFNLTIITICSFVRRVTLALKKGLLCVIRGVFVRWAKLSGV